MPTPGMAFLTADMRCDAGVMISASHNPLPGQRHQVLLARRLQAARRDRGAHRGADRVAASSPLAARARRTTIGRAQRIDDATGRYVVFLKKTFPRELSLDGLRVVLDCANGAAYKVGPDGARASSAPRCSAIGVAAERAQHQRRRAARCIPRRRAAKVRELRADVGIALDGDADRCVIVDEKGNVVDGDALLALARARHGRARRAARRRRRRDRDEQPRPRARARAAAASGSCAPRSATATSSRRCARAATTSAASSRATSSSSTTTPPATA